MPSASPAAVVTTNAATESHHSNVSASANIPASGSVGVPVNAALISRSPRNETNAMPGNASTYAFATAPTLVCPSLIPLPPRPPRQARPHALSVRRPPRRHAAPRRIRRRPRDLSETLYRTVMWVMFVLLFCAAFCLLLWTIFQPTFPQLNVASVTMSTIVTTATTASAELNITLFLTSSNRYFTNLFDLMEISLIYPSKHVLLSQDFQNPFEQHGKSRTAVTANLSFVDLNLGEGVVQTLNQDLNRGSLRLEISVVSTVRYIIGKWKSSRHFMRAYCGDLNFKFDSRNELAYQAAHFMNPLQKCDIFLYSE